MDGHLGDALNVVLYSRQSPPVLLEAVFEVNLEASLVFFG